MLIRIDYIDGAKEYVENAYRFEYSDELSCFVVGAESETIYFPKDFIKSIRSIEESENSD